MPDRSREGSAFINDNPNPPGWKAADQLKERISVMESMIREHRQELFAYCYDLINFTPKSSNSKKDGTEFLKIVRL